MNTKFYILTRFNSMSFPKRKRYMKNNLNDKWLQTRLELFKKYTIPSILNQSNQDFEWIIYCHSESPEWLIEELSMIDKITISLEYWYKNALDISADILVTSRVDTDDLLHRDYMLNIHNHLDEFKASGLDRQLYVFENGYCYEVEKNRMFDVSNKNGPFHTLFADIRDNKGKICVYHTRHESISREQNTHYSTKHGWMYVRHGGNISGCDFTIQGTTDINVLKQFTEGK